jgi:NAD-dependent SIR2 family protein deacetylase
MSDEKTIAEAVEILAAAKKAILFTGAGISVESGIPPFRGAAGLWSQVNPDFIEIENFTRNPSLCWPLIKKLFYDKWGEAKPNAAHYAAAALQKGGRLDEIITQNIDCLHQRAGARDVLEFHGTLESLVCMGCGLKRPSASWPDTESFRAAPDAEGFSSRTSSSSANRFPMTSLRSPSRRRAKPTSCWSSAPAARSCRPG